MTQVPNVPPDRPAFNSAKVKVFHAISMWEVICKGFQEHARDLKMLFEVQAYPRGSAHRALFARPQKAFNANLIIAIPDVVHALSCALDHVMFELFEIYGGKESDARMPFARSRAEIEKYLRTKAPSLPQPIAEWILDSVRPYKEGGDQDLWRIRQLDNIDKHRQIQTGTHIATVLNFNMQAGGIYMQNCTVHANFAFPSLVMPLPPQTTPHIFNDFSLGEVRITFNEPSIFEKPEEPMGDFFFRVGSRLTTLLDEIVELIYGSENSTIRGPNEDHRGWQTCTMPAPTKLMLDQMAEGQFARFRPYDRPRK